MKSFEQFVYEDCSHGTIQEFYTNPLLLNEKVAGNWDK